jgi:organic hydroperoxide reductase OsmC/OhrA
VARAARQFRYAAAIDREGRLFAEGADPFVLPAAWTPEHLLLVAVARCTLKSLRYHADRAGVGVTASADMASTVSRREADGRYAVVELTIDFELELVPQPSAELVDELLFKAERDCFVGNSLSVRPRWTWRVNGQPAGLATRA